MVTRESESGQDLDDAAFPESANHSRRPAPRNAVAVAVIRWGRDASSDVLRKRARWTACGHKGGTIQHPGRLPAVSDLAAAASRPVRREPIDWESLR